MQKPLNLQFSGFLFSQIDTLLAEEFFSLGRRRHPVILAEFFIKEGLAPIANQADDLLDRQVWPGQKADGCLHLLLVDQLNEAQPGLLFDQVGKIVGAETVISRRGRQAG